jgi:hypothetical protein
MDRYPPDWAARWPANQRDRKIYDSSKQLPDKELYGNRDLWLERYLAFFDREIARLNAGVIARHYRRCAEASYREFQTSQTAAARFCSWLAIRAVSQWVVQLETYAFGERRSS